MAEMLERQGLSAPQANAAAERLCLESESEIPDAFYTLRAREHRDKRRNLALLALWILVLILTPFAVSAFFPALGATAFKAIGLAIGGLAIGGILHWTFFMGHR